MAITKPKTQSLSDLFFSITNPKQSNLSVSSPIKTAQTTPATPFQSNAQTPIKAVPGSPIPTAPLSTAAPVVTNSPSTSIFNGPSSLNPTGATGPSTSTGATGATGPSIPSSWINPSNGQILSPEEIASGIATKMTSRGQNGDVGNISADNISGGKKTPEQLITDARNLNNTRNDIAVGETDPDKVASESGIAYTPEELSAIEKAKAGVYDPAINSVYTKLDKAQKDQDAADTAKAKSADDERQFQNDLKKLAVTHDYDLEKLAKSNEYAKGIKQMELNAKAATAKGQSSAYQDEQSQRTVDSVDALIPLAQANPGIFGRSADVPIPDFLRSDAYRNFNGQLDTLKASITFNELQAMRAASKTGGALGQVSDIEGRLLSSALGSLKMDQTPENVVSQLKNIKDSINRFRQAQGASTLGSTDDSTDSNIVTDPDGNLVEITD